MLIFMLSTEPSVSPTAGIILGILLVISLLINALLVVYLMKSINSRDSGMGAGERATIYKVI